MMKNLFPLLLTCVLVTCDAQTYRYGKPPTTGVQPSPAPTPLPTKASRVNFNIDLDLVGINATYRTFFRDAKSRWETIVRGDLENFSTKNLAPLSVGCVYPKRVDDLYICAQFIPIDGPFNIIGSGNPAYIRPDGLPGTGEMTFDSSDIKYLKRKGLLGTIILHEIGHILGIGSLWEQKNITGPDTLNCPYMGPRANAEYKDITGCDVVPTENAGTIDDGSFCGHWADECLQSELMTSFIDRGLNPLSRITIATLDDLGYAVDYSTADSYGRSDVASTCTCGQRLLSDETAHGKVRQLGTSHKSTPRRSLSEEARVAALTFGRETLEQRQAKKAFFQRDNADGILDDMLYVGDKMVDVFVEEDGAIFDVTVTL